MHLSAYCISTSCDLLSATGSHHVILFLFPSYKLTSGKVIEGLDRILDLIGLKHVATLCLTALELCLAIETKKAFVANELVLVLTI
jgi:hypothetical protein